MEAGQSRPEVLLGDCGVSVSLSDVRPIRKGRKHGIKSRGGRQDIETEMDEMAGHWVKLGPDPLALIYKVDLGLLRRSFAEMEVFWLGPMILIYLLGFPIRGARWQLMLKPIKRVGIRTLTEGVLVGYMGNNLLPARAGEFSGCFSGTKKPSAR